MHMERDWGETAATAEDLAHGGHGVSAAERARRTAEGWAGDARDAMSDIGDRASTAYDETVGRARETAADWAEGANATARDARDRASDLYDETRGGVRRMAHRAAGYGRAAREAVQPNGSLANFCREQPMLVAGLGLAVGAALAAMIPSSRAERQVMGEPSREVQDRVREAASGTLHAMSGEQREQPSGESQRESWKGEAAPGTGNRSETSRGETWREPAREAAAEVERGVRRSDRASNLETDPQRAPYAEAAEAGAMGTTPQRQDESQQRT
jgi:hypothetical protein